MREVLSRHAAGPGLLNFFSRRITRLHPGFGQRFFYRWRTYEPHIHFSEAEGLLPPCELESCFKFCFVRNPYERLVSFFRHIEKLQKHPFHKRVKHWGGFAGLVENLEELAEPSQLSYTLDCSGRPSMDFVGRFENIDRDFGIVAGRLGLEAQLPHRNANTGGHWRDFFTDSLRRRVCRYYNEDFVAFGYSDEIP